MLGTEILKYRELLVKHVEHNLKVSKDSKNIYADLKITPWEFQVGDQVYVKVKPQKVL